TDSFGSMILQVCEGRYGLDAADCVGGAPAFLALIGKEVLPLLHERYRIDTDSLGLFGVSAGGFFASWTLLQKDSPFANYIIPSPAMAYGDGEIFREEARYAQHHEDLVAGVYMASGTLEIGTAYYEGTGKTVSGMAALAGTLTARGYPGLRISTGMHQGLGHSDAAAATLAIGLRTLYPK
ncbi:MAG: alpha/beta hydrolase-fold protein, partial [Gammaproteobacteria bacterium]